MKSIVFIILVFFSCFSIKAQQKGFTVKANLKNLSTSKVIIAYSKDGKYVIDDKYTLENGQLIFKGEVNEPTMASLVVRNPSLSINVGDGSIPSPSLQFFISNGNVITVTGDANKVYMASVNGGKANNEWNKIKSQIAKLTDQSWESTKLAHKLVAQHDSSGFKKSSAIREINGAKEEKLGKDFISKYPNSLVSMMLLSNMVNSIGLEELDKAYMKLDEENKQTVWAKRISDKIENMSATAIGKMSRDFSKKDMNGATVTLASLKGKYVLIDFWGSWCSPCRASHPYLKKVYSQYKDKGFEIVGVALEQSTTLEENKKTWLEAIEKDGLPWIQILNNEDVDKFDLVKNYGVTAFPTKVLLDKDGKIVARYVGDDEEGFSKKLKELFGE